LLSDIFHKRRNVNCFRREAIFDQVKKKPRGSFPVSRIFSELRIERNGSAVGIHHQMFREYLINLKWDAPLDNEAIERIRLLS
jgi:hypothetical protein